MESETEVASFPVFKAKSQRPPTKATQAVLPKRESTRMTGSVVCKRGNR
jgi:hypothetical protein